MTVKLIPTTIFDRIERFRLAEFSVSDGIKIQVFSRKNGKKQSLSLLLFQFLCIVGLPSSGRFDFFCCVQR
jgi:hypothetical protein